MNYIENTRYGFKNAEGHRLHVSTVGAERDHVELAIAGVGDLGWRSLNIPAAEVPGIALALLRAAGYGQIHEHIPAHDDFPAMVELAAGHLSDAVTVMEQNTMRKHLAAELTRRRDELTVSLMRQAGFTASVARYELAAPVAQAAIDMIIQLQDEATK